MYHVSGLGRRDGVIIGEGGCARKIEGEPIYISLESQLSGGGWRRKIPVTRDTAQDTRTLFRDPGTFLAKKCSKGPESSI